MSDSSKNPNIQQGGDVHEKILNRTTHLQEEDDGKSNRLSFQESLRVAQAKNQIKLDALLKQAAEMRAASWAYDDSLDKCDPRYIERSFRRFDHNDIIAELVAENKDAYICKVCRAKADDIMEARLMKGHSSQTFGKKVYTDNIPNVSKLSIKEEKNPLVNPEESALQVSEEKQKSEPSNKVDGTDDTPNDSKKTGDSPLIGSKD